MRTKRLIAKWNIRWVMAFLVWSACVDPMHFNLPPAQLLTVVEGTITDSPGPYTVKVSRGLDLNTDSIYRTPILNLKIKLFDDAGNSEAFTGDTTGTYVTGGIIQGQIGHAYHIEITTPEGKIFTSTPDSIRPVGNVQQVRYEFEARSVQTQFGPFNEDVFKIYFDAEAGSDPYVRWRYTGTYKVVSHPELHYYWSEGFILKDPLPCSGYIVAPLPGGPLEQVAECTCCTCWATQYEAAPMVSDGQFVVNNQYQNVKVAEVPINGVTFHEKYMVRVEQMSLTRQSYDFFRLIRAQKEGATNLFQPPSGEIRGNIHPVNSNDKVIGLFWATSVKERFITIQASDVPYPLPPIDASNLACTSFTNATTTKPAFWE